MVEMLYTKDKEMLKLDILKKLWMLNLS